jgi:hypothetical protein
MSRSTGGTKVRAEKNSQEKSGQTNTKNKSNMPSTDSSDDRWQALYSWERKTNRTALKMKKARWWLGVRSQTTRTSRVGRTADTWAKKNEANRNRRKGYERCQKQNPAGRRKRGIGNFYGGKSHKQQKQDFGVESWRKMKTWVVKINTDQI